MKRLSWQRGRERRGEGGREKELVKQDIKFSPIENDERFELASLLCVCVCVCVSAGVGWFLGPLCLEHVSGCMSIVVVCTCSG